MQTRRHLAAVAGSAVAVAAATGLVYALRPIAPALSLGVLYIPAVLVSAILFGTAYAVATALVSMVAFNFLFLPPVHTLTLSNGEDWTALAVYVGTAVVVSDLATRARRRAAEAEQRERETALIADAAAALLQEAPLDEISARAERVLEGADATSRVRFEAAMASLEALTAERREADAIKRSDALKTVILQTVSHDFRTPIATISAAVGGLQHGALELSDADRGELLETIRLETARLARLVENVLDLSRLQAGAASPHVELWDVDDIVGQSVAETSDAGRVRIEVAGDLPPVRVDAVQIQRVLVNLIENALKFSAGEVDVVAFADGAAVAVAVDDRGPGLDGSPSSARGLGLGLEIARGFAHVNGAALSFADREGGGTRASVVLPAAPLPRAALR